MNVLKDLINYGGAGALLVMGLGVVVEITPCKINPIQWLGDRLNHSMKADITELKTDIEEIKKQQQIDKADDARYRILRFDDEIRHQPTLRHTEEHFNQIMSDIKEYNEYCSSHPNYRNHKATSAIKKITEIYEECREKNGFLV